MFKIRAAALALAITGAGRVRSGREEAQVSGVARRTAWRRLRRLQAVPAEWAGQRDRRGVPVTEIAAGIGLPCHLMFSVFNCGIGAADWMRHCGSED